jgi:hypothetical protein
MLGLFKRRRLPSERRPSLDVDERIVAWAGALDDDVVVVTNFGLWLPGATERLGWHEIHKATWSGRQLALVAAREVADGDGYTVMEDLPVLVVTLLDPDHVPEQVRTRVNRSVGYTSHHPLPEGGGVRVVGRRVSGVNGLRWTVRYDEGTDRDAPGIADSTAEFVAQAQVGTSV